jgi:hypothetical protein
MDEYDKKAWDALDRERQRQLARSPRRLLPQSVRDQAAQFREKARDTFTKVPGSAEAQELVEQVFLAASDAATKIAAYSLWEARIIRAYQQSGHVSVQRISDIQGLGLRPIDDVKPHFDLAYMAAGGVSGAAAGLAVTGGEIAALIGGGAGAAAGGAGGGGVGAAPGAGVGAAPGAAVVVTAMAADTAAVLFGTARVIFHTAAYYGYDTNRPEERLRALGVLNFATAGGQAAKNRAYLDLEKLVGLIVRNAAWRQLDQNVVTKIVRRVFELLGQRLTKKKLAGAVPLAGILIGAGINVRTLSTTADAADMLYRQQFLCDKHDRPFPSGPTEPAAPAGEEDDIPLADIIEEETEESSGDVDDDDESDPKSPPDVSD